MADGSDLRSAWVNRTEQVDELAGSSDLWTGWLFGVADASVTVTPTAAALVLTASTPAIANPKTAAPTAASLTVTCATPAIATPFRVTPVAASLSATGSTPTVSVSAAVTVTPTAASLTVTGTTPDVEAIGTQFLTPTGAVLTLYTFEPEITGAEPAIQPGGSRRRSRLIQTPAPLAIEQDDEEVVLLAMTA